MQPPPLLLPGPALVAELCAPPPHPPPCRPLDGAVTAPPPPALADGNQFTLDGTQTDGDHSPGLVAMNAVAALCSDLPIAWDFVDALWNTTAPCVYLEGVENERGALIPSRSHTAAGADSGATMTACSISRPSCSSRVAIGQAGGSDASRAEPLASQLCVQ